MTEGTKSYLIGCHQFFFHPLWVLLAWRLEYKSWPKWWEIVCIFLHDVGICGRQYLGDDEIKMGHWIRGARLSAKIIAKFPHKFLGPHLAFEFCAGHCPEESNYPESKLFRPDKSSPLMAPMWWLWWNYWIEGFVATPRLWKKLVAENLRSRSPIGNHELYSRYKEHGPQ